MEFQFPNDDEGRVDRYNFAIRFQNALAEASFFVGNAVRLADPYTIKNNPTSRQSYIKEFLSLATLDDNAPGTLQHEYNEWMHQKRLYETSAMNGLFVVNSSYALEKQSADVLKKRKIDFYLTWTDAHKILEAFEDKNFEELPWLEELHDKKKFKLDVECVRARHGHATGGIID